MTPGEQDALASVVADTILAEMLGAVTDGVTFDAEQAEYVHQALFDAALETMHRLAADGSRLLSPVADDEDDDETDTDGLDDGGYEEEDGDLDFDDDGEDAPAGGE